MEYLFKTLFTVLARYKKNALIGLVYTGARNFLHLADIQPYDQNYNNRIPITSIFRLHKQ